MGPEKARSASRRLIDQGVAALASWGIAGGLDPALTAGCLIIPRNVIAADSSIYHTDTAWRERLSGRIAARIPVNDGSLAECDSIIAERPEKLADTGADGRGGGLIWRARPLQGKPWRPASHFWR